MQIDIFEKHLTPGSFVVYGIRSGNTGGVRFGLVLNGTLNKDIEPYKQRVQVLTYEKWSAGTRFSVSRPSTYNMVKVAEGTFPEVVEQELITEWSRRLREKK